MFPRGPLSIAAVALLLAWAPPSSARDSARELLTRSEDQVRIAPETSRALAEQALAMLEREPDPDLAVWAHLLLCEHAAERDRAVAEQHVAAARNGLAQARRRGFRARLLACEGEIQEAEGNSTGALTLYEQAVVSAEATGDAEYLAESLYRRGHLRSLRAEYATGLSDLRRAHTLYEQEGKAGHATIVQNAIAILYNRMGDPAQARHYFEAALKAQAGAGMTREQLVTQHNLGRALENLGDWGAAEHAFTQSLALSQQLQYGRGEAYALRGLASTHNARGRPAEALELLDRAARLQRQFPDIRLRGQIQLQRGISLASTRRSAEAAAALQEALVVFKTAESPAELARTHEELSRLLASQADWRGALEQQRQARELIERLLRRQIDERFATLKVEYDSAAREQEMRLLQREQSATAYALEQERLAGRLRSVTVALGAVLLTLVALLGWRQRRGRLAMRRLALTDELTDLPNRRDVLARMEAWLKRGDACALLILDLDHFKRINDSHGHLAGDEVLRRAAAALRAATPAGAILGRLGGEEFLVALPVPDLDAAMPCAERLRRAIESMDLSASAQVGTVTASIGVTVALPGESLGTLLSRADRALYGAKEGGRNRVVARDAPDPNQTEPEGDDGRTM